MSNLPPDFSLIVTPAPVRNQIEDNLRRAILRGHFRPGQHLPDRMLCELLHVSRPALREAVRMLAVEGLVDTIPHKGTFVRSISGDEASEIYELRAVLEALLAKSFTELATDEQVQKLRSIYEEFEEGATEEDQEDALEIKRRFYDVQLKAVGNDYLTDRFNAIISRTTLLRWSTLTAPGRLPSAKNELRRLIEAVEARDIDGAWHAAMDYVLSAAAVVADIFPSEAADVPAN